LPACKLEFDSFKVGIALESLASNAVRFAGETAPPELRLYLSTRAHVEARVHGPRRDVADLTPGWLRPSPDADPADPEIMLVMEVKDTGIGIPRSEVEKVFQPFTQAVNSPTRGVRGAGLGLAMAKRIADAHNGEIFVRSALGQGTIFTIAIPAAPARSV
jgi:signal transduction histidine kinase